MNAHPSRSGAISAQLFAEFVAGINASADGEMSDGWMRQQILNAAMRITMQRAGRKFRWPADVKWDADFDSFGQPFNIRLDFGSDYVSVTAEESAWIFAEVQKIAKHALAALEAK